MSSLETNAKLLADFGLTHNQAKVYIAAARLKLASVSQISKASRVRREDVYRILPKLEKMGVVEKLLGTPTQIRAIPVEDALTLLIKHHEDSAREKVSALKAKKTTFLTHFKQAPRLTVEKQAEFTLSSTRESIQSKMLTMLTRAEREVDIVCSKRKLTQIIYLFAEQLKRALTKGVQIRVLSELSEYEGTLPRVLEDVLEPSTALKMRYVDLPAGHYMIVDFNEALIATATTGNLGEHPCLWTNSDSLLGVFQGDFEDLWHHSVSWDVIETTTSSEKLFRFLEELRPTDHLIFVYESDEAKHTVLFNYLKVGLDNGEAGVYVASDEKPNHIRAAMNRFGIPVEKYEEIGALQIFEYQNFYIIDGQFSPTTTLQKWKTLYTEAIKQGFNGLRVTGETACFFKHNLVQELLEYEKALHVTLDFPIVAICAYSADILNKSTDPVNIYSELARAHSTVLFTGLDNTLGKMEIRKI